MEPTEQPFCPYKGLAPFDEQDYAYFFGRERETRLIVANLFASPLTLLYGPSGVGKSSVLRAGAMHELRSNLDALVIPAFASWQQESLRELTQWIAAAASEITSVTDSFSSLSLTEMIRTLCDQTGRRVTIVLDQFEEYFLYSRRNDEFVEAFAHAVLSTDSDVGFIISIREDSLARLDAFEGRIPHMFETFLRIDHLDRLAARDAIVKPLDRYNEDVANNHAWSIEPSLVEDILNEIGGGVYFSESARAAAKVRDDRGAADQIETPYLQLVMTKLWDEESKAQSRRLRSRTYHNLGNAEQIVRTHVEAVLDTRLTRDERQMAFQVFHYLVTPSRAKVAHSASDLASYAGVRAEQMKTMLTKLVGGRDRILRTVANPNDPVDERFEIFHDRLAAAILEWRSRYTRESIAASTNTSLAEPSGDRSTSGIALCLSGRGFRAMLFHLGALWRLNECGYLRKLARVSSVSGGSIAAGMLGLKWSKLGFTGDGIAQNLVSEVVDPIRALASKTIDEGSIIGGILSPGSIADRVTDAYRKHLFGESTLQDLPDDPPRFLINATSVQSGALFRFSRPYLADYRVGRVLNPKVELAVAVAASSVFPPILSPLKFELEASAWAPPSGQESEDLHREGYLTEVVLTDGSVYDNLALETSWKAYDTILVSDGGGRMAPEAKPHSDWARHAVRINDLIDNQVRSLRRRQVIESFMSRDRKGTYWGIGSDIADYSVKDALECPLAQTAELAVYQARLVRVPEVIQQRIINWGYAVCDAAMRSNVDITLKAGQFPYPSVGVGE